MMEEEMKQAFQLMDTDGDGFVSTHDLIHIFNQLGGKISPAEAKALIKKADKDQSGAVDWQEFQSLWSLLKNYGDDGSQEEKLIREEFQRLDHDGSGFISKEEMLKSISECENLRGSKEEEAKKCLDDIDIDGDGKVSYPEFLMVWKFK